MLVLHYVDFQMKCSLDSNLHQTVVSVNNRMRLAGLDLIPLRQGLHVCMFQSNQVQA